MPLTICTQRFSLQALHRLPQFSEALHGHHFYVEVSVQPQAREDLATVFAERVFAALDGRDLGQTLTPPTGENLALWTWRELKSSSLGPYLVGVVVQETEKNRYYAP